MARHPSDWFPRLWAKTEVVPGPRPTPCWISTGATVGNGYAVVRTGSKAEGNARLSYAHCVAYERYRGPIPDGHELDHLCRRRNCWNPWHTEAVTRVENIRRGAGKGGLLRPERTECRYGHALTGSNVYVAPNGRKFCRQCHADSSNAYYRRKVG